MSTAESPGLSAEEIQIMVGIGGAWNDTGRFLHLADTDPDEAVREFGIPIERQEGLAEHIRSAQAEAEQIRSCEVWTPMSIRAQRGI